MSFEELTQRAVESTLRDVLGKGGAGAVMYVLKEHSVDLGKVAADPDSFEKAMRFVFRDGWEVLSRLATKRIFEELGGRPDFDANRTFAEQLSAASKLYEAHELRVATMTHGAVRTPKQEVMGASWPGLKGLQS